MNNEKIIALVTKLHKKSIEGTIEWEITDKINEFQTSVPQYAIRIVLFERYEPYEIAYYLRIYNSEGKLIESIGSGDFAGDWFDALPKFREIYEMARRKALGVDGAIDNILATLDEENPF